MRDLNFFSQYQEKKQEKRNTKIYFYVAYGVLALFILGTVSYSGVKIVMLNKDIKSYTEKLNADDFQSKLIEANEVSGKLDGLNKYQTALSDVTSSIERNNIITVDLLNDICGAIPADVSFKDLKIDGYDVTISGISHSRNAIGEYEHNLKNLSKIKKVQVVKIDKDNTVGNDYSFDITCVLKEVN